MLTLMRAEERHHHRRKKCEIWVTFRNGDGGHSDPLADGFGVIAFLNEMRFAPGAQRAFEHRDAETVTYVREGTLSFSDSTGQGNVIDSNEFHCFVNRPRVRSMQRNVSQTDSAHAFEIGLRFPHRAVLGCIGQKRFSVAERRGEFLLVASGDARNGSLRLHQEIDIYSAVLDRGQHVVHALGQGHSAWLHIIEGEAILGDVVLKRGDGSGFRAERSVSVTASEVSELLLLDLAEPKN